METPTRRLLTQQAAHGDRQRPTTEAGVLYSSAMSAISTIIG